MDGSVRLQEWIHRLEVGSGARYLRWLLALVAFAGLAIIYNALCFQNFRTAEAMDSAQLARHLARGDGYVTSWVRPLSIALLRDKGSANAWQTNGSPDISNPPVYPALVSGLLRLTPPPPDLTAVRNFRIAPPDLFVAIFNQCLLGVGAFLLFGLARRWFDAGVAWIAMTLFIGTELYWQFTVSGLSTILLIDLVLALAWTLATFEQSAREGGRAGKPIALAFLAGLIVGVALLTRYSMGWLLLPVLLFVGMCATSRKVGAVAGVAAGFAAAAAPWIVRNMAVSGWPFGTATFALFADTPAFPGDTLERALSPAFTGMPGYTSSLFGQAFDKGIANMREIVSAGLPGAGGTWLWAFFLVGLMVRFRNISLSRMRWFVVGALAVMVPVQAVARTHWSTELPVINSENLLVVLSPLLIVFGVGVFFVLLESIDLPSRAVRYAAVSAFVGVMILPMLLALAPPHPRASAPPYYPPRIQQVASYLGPEELMMSDIPWAVAWYGQRQSVSLPLTWGRGFAAVHEQKPVNGLYVSTRTTDAKFFSSWFAGENEGWGSFLLHSFVRHEIPDGFPLKNSPEGLFVNGELLLMDRDRWGTGGATGEKAKKD